MHNNLSIINRVSQASSSLPRATHFLLALLFLMPSLIACDQSIDPEITAPVPLIKEMTSYRNDTITSKKTYEYDQQGRQLRSATNNTAEKYVYEPGKVLMEIYWADTNKKVNYTLVLNSRGLMEHQEGSSESFEYDAQGYLIQTVSGATFKSTIEGGNLVRVETWSSENGTSVLSSVVTRTFFNDKPNTIGMENTGLSFFGKQDRNPVKRETYYNPKLELETYITYEYEYDAQNRIIKRKSSNVPNFYNMYTYVE